MELQHPCPQGQMSIAQEPACPPSERRHRCAAGKGRQKALSPGKRRWDPQVPPVLLPAPPGQSLALLALGPGGTGTASCALPCCLPCRPPCNGAPRPPQCAEGRHARPRDVPLTHSIAAAPLPRALGAAGELAIKPQLTGPWEKRSNSSRCCTGPETRRKCLLRQREPLASSGDSLWPGAVLREAAGNASEARKRALARDTELDRSRSQDFAFQLSIGNRVFFIISSFIKIHNY